MNKLMAILVTLLFAVGMGMAQTGSTANNSTNSSANKGVQNESSNPNYPGSGYHSPLNSSKKGGNSGAAATGNGIAGNENQAGGAAATSTNAGAANSQTAATTRHQDRRAGSAAVGAQADAGHNGAAAGANGKRRLPQTASPLPEIALLGLVSLSLGAVVLRKKAKQTR